MTAHTHHAHAHPHSHGLVDASIKRSRAGLQAVGLALLLLGLTAVAQAIVFAASGSVALLGDLIHNAGDAATAIPLGIAFALRSATAERLAGLAVVLAIFVSACVAGFEAIDRLIDPREIEHVGALAAAGALGCVGNWIAAIVRTRAGRRLDSRPNRRRRPCSRRRLRKPGGRRKRRRRGDRRRDRRPADRARHRARHPAHYLAVLANGPWRASSSPPPRARMTRHVSRPWLTAAPLGRCESASTRPLEAR
jgi:Co/Zn/Cd efflux system component